MISKIGYKGIINFKQVRNGNIVREEIFKNMITDDNLDEMTKSLLGETGDNEIKYIAFGTSSNQLEGSQQTLINEIYRSGVIDLYRNDIGQISSEFLIDKLTTFSSLIYEIGIFGGSLATSTTNSGLMLCRLLPSSPLNKLASGDEWFFQRIDTLANV